MGFPVGGLLGVFISALADHTAVLHAALYAVGIIPALGVFPACFGTVL